MTIKKVYFGVILGLMTLGGIGIFVSGQKTFSENENRYLNTFSKIESTDDVEKVVVDQFALRDRWLSLSTGMQYAVGYREINNTYIGADGYLFDACAPWDFSLNAYVKNLNYLKVFHDSYNVRMQVALVPSPYTVLADRLPAGANVYDAQAAYEAAKTILNSESISNDVTQHDTGLHVIDLRERLTDLSKSTQVYYHSDHHWTTMAAREAYYALGGTAPEDTLKLEPVTDSFLGTMYSRVLLSGAVKDTIYALSGATETAAKEGEAVLYDAAKLEVKDKYAFFLGGNSARVDYVGEGEGKLLVIKDSFANCLVPFLLKDYASVTVLDLRFFNGDIGELMAEDFDGILVLYEMSNFASDTSIYKLIQ